MKLLSLASLLLVVTAVTVNAATLGSSKCSYGPSYWCGTISQATECGALQYCSDNDWAAIITKDGGFCTDCKTGLDILRKQLENVKTEDEIIKLVESFCSDLGALAADCKLVVEAYGPQVLKSLIQELQPEQVCALMGFCKAETFVTDPKKDQSAVIMTQLLDRASTKLMEIMLTQMFAGDKMCTDCTNFVNDIKNLLNNATVEAMITSEVKKLCQYLGSYKIECELIVTTLIPQGIGQLVEKIDPKKDCGEIGFCKSLLSDEPVPEPPASDPCTDCKAFMGDVKTILSNATVQQMIIKDLETFCNDLGSLAPQCQEYVDQYGPLVFTFLLQYFDPNMVCSTIGFCKSEELMMASDDVCSDCKTYVEDAATFLSNPSVQKSMLIQVAYVCKSLKITDNCDEFVSEYGPMLINLFLEYLDPATVCSGLGFCAAETMPEALPEPGDICSDCQSFVKDFDKLLNNYTIQEKLLKDVVVLCKYFPNYSADCKKYVEQYGALVFEVIAGLINPKTVCSDIGLCQGVTRPRPTLPKLPVAILRTFAPNDVCGDCKNLFQDVQSILSDPSVQKMIISELELLCNDLGPFGPQCKTYVDQYGPLVFTFLLQYIDPDAICSDIGLCSAEFPQSPVNQNADMCADCKAFLADVSTILNTPAVQQMILKEIGVLCNDLGPSLGPQCQEYVSEYGPLVINFILQYLDPPTICADIGFCSGVKSIQPLAFTAIKTILKMPTVASDLCSDCKALVNDADSLLKNTTIQKMFLNDLSVVCKYFGGLQSECKELIMEYGPLVFQYITAYIDPTTICDEIGLCPAITLRADQCADCKNFFQDVATILNNPATQQEILQEIETLCGQLGPSLGPQCQEYVSEYGPLVINFVLQYLDPTAICGDIGFCPTITRSPKVIGDECTDCKNFLQDVSNILKNTTVQQMIITELETLCNNLGPSLGPQCQQYVSEYGQLVISFALQYLDPTAICGDIGFCAAVSKPEILFKLNADQCADCKNFFQDVSTILNNPATQQMIITEIETLCNDLGPSLGPQCQQYVSEYGPLVINFVLQYLDPTAICGDIGFCPAVSESEKFKLNADQCADCKNFFQDVSTILSNPATQQMIIQGIENLCNDLGPSLGPQCEEYVSEYGPLVINFILQYLDPNAICGDIGFCPNTIRSFQWLVEANTDQCTDCKNFLQDVVTILNTPSVQQMIIQDIENICNSLGPSLGPQCQQYVSEYGPLVINFVLQYLDPASVCSDIGFCSGVKQTVPLVELTVALPFSPINDEPLEDVGPMCEVCKMVVAQIDIYLKEGSTQKEITTALAKLCSVLPGTLSDQCSAFIEQYGAVILQLLANHMEPEQVCGFIKLCVAEFEQSTTCTLCEYVMQQLDTLITKQSTEAEIEAALEQVCALLPSSLSGECKQFVEQYTTTIINLIIQEVPPKLICRTLGLCSKSPDSDVHEVLGPACVLCQYVLRELETLLAKESTVSDIEAALDKVCSLLPMSVVQKCQTFVDTYTPTIVNLLVKSVPPRLVCVAIRLCLFVDAPVSEPKAEANEFCAICEFAMSQLDKILVEPGTEAQIENGLDMVCGLLPSTISEMCKSFISQYTKEIIFLLTQSLSPKQVCSALTLCTSIESADEVLLVEEKTDHIDEERFEASTECIVCEYAMRELEKQLGKNATEEEIRLALDQVCDLLPDTLKEDCNILINYYTTEVIYQFIRKYPANKICTLLKVCAAVNGELKTVAHVDVNQEPLCPICEFAVKELEQMLQKDSTEASIRKALDTLCSRLPSTVAKDCQTFVDYYTEEIIFILVSQFPPSTLCTTIKLCTASQSTLEITEKVDENTPLCAICEFVAKYLEDDLQKNSTEAEITKALDLVCSKLPTTITKECQMFVDYYTEEIIFILTSQFPPNKLCSTLKLCAAVEEPPLDASVSCEVCVIAIRSAELYITKNTTEQEIDKVLEYLCQGFPGSLKEQCITFVEQFGNAIPELIVNFGDPEKICQLLDLCPKEVDMKQLMFEKCNTGPEFWCASRTNADLCNAVEHCKRHVWQ